MSIEAKRVAVMSSTVFYTSGFLRRQPPKVTIGVALGFPRPLGRRPEHFPSLDAVLAHSYG
jgi:hypothetical protein